MIKKYDTHYTIPHCNPLHSNLDQNSYTITTKRTESVGKLTQITSYMDLLCKRGGHSRSSTVRKNGHCCKFHSATRLFTTKIIGFYGRT